MTARAVPPAGDAALVVTIHDLAFVDHPDAFTRRGVSFHTRGLEIAEREADGPELWERAQSLCPL